MPTRPFRFLHASDLHLERPPQGISEVPENLRHLFVDAPFRAAERVFDAAIGEQVELVALAGDIIEPGGAGPRGLAFLAEQFQRLADRGIAVYWAGGRTDRLDGWTDALRLPEAVHIFPLNRVQRIVHERDGQPLLQVLGASSEHRQTIRTADFQPERSGLFSLAIAYGTAEAELFAQSGINYWALGGEHGRHTLVSSLNTAHSCGTPQGRRPRESGARGCTLVAVDDEGHARTSFVPTDVLRWQREQIAIHETTTREQLEQQLHARAAAMWNNGAGPDTLVSWTIEGASPLAARIRRGKLGVELVSRLRAAFGQKRPALWTVSLDCESAASPPADKIEEDTLLGEFLRSIKQYQADDSAPLDLEPFLTERHVAGSVASAVAIDDKATRDRVLGEVAQLGLDLLSGEEAPA